MKWGENREREMADPYKKLRTIELKKLLRNITHWKKRIEKAEKKMKR
jgi:hypothetical protein